MLLRVKNKDSTTLRNIRVFFLRREKRYTKSEKKVDEKIDINFHIKRYF